MAPRDLIEAQGFRRRRLVAAFVTGTTDGGRGGAPPRGGRLVGGGVALSVLLLAGAAFASWWAPATTADWGRPSLVVSEDTGQPYVVLEATGTPVLHPVVNVVSARLVLGTDRQAPQIVPEEVLRERSRGAAIGIPGAPDSLPPTDRLVDTGWTACTADQQGIRVGLSTHPGAAAVDGRGVVVRTRDGGSWVVATAAARTGEVTRTHRYRVPSRGSTQDLLLATLGLGPREAAAVVPTDWVRLFPRGGDLDLDSFGLARIGSAASGPGGAGLPAGARVGDWVVSGERALLVTDRGPTPLEPWALAVYEAAAAELADSPGRPAPRRLGLGSLPGGAQVEPAYLAARWPAAPVEPLVGEPCAVLETGAGHTPGVALGTQSAGRSVPTSVPAARTQVQVEPGHGAHVRPVGWDGSPGGPTALVDDTGRLFPLSRDETEARLGYADHPPPGVPTSWLSLLGRGVSLSPAAALCPPQVDLRASAGRAPPRDRTPRCGR